MDLGELNEALFNQTPLAKRAGQQYGMWCIQWNDFWIKRTLRARRSRQGFITPPTNKSAIKAQQAGGSEAGSGRGLGTEAPPARLSPAVAPRNLNGPSVMAVSARCAVETV
jgi:hypothetical protein